MLSKAAETESQNLFPKVSQDGRAGQGNLAGGFSHGRVVLAHPESEITATGGGLVTTCRDVTREEDCSRMADLALKLRTSS
jgi:hypothetical protein